jgi:pimeloyl-ACP methyl ester carboxylesterase
VSSSYDRAGFAWSDSPAAPQSLHEHAADLHAVLSGSGSPGPYILVGHSLGGPLIRLYARDHLTDTAGFVFVDAPDETAMFRQPYQDFNRKTLRPMMGAIKLATSLGVMRVWDTLFPGQTLTPSQVSADARAAVRSMSSPARIQAGIDDLDSVLNAPEDMRREFGFGGQEGARPVSVITHGVKFPPPFDTLEVGSEDGQARLAALSTDSELIVAEKSNHLIQLDERPRKTLDFHSPAEKFSQCVASTG